MTDEGPAVGKASALQITFLNEEERTRLTVAKEKA